MTAKPKPTTTNTSRRSVDAKTRARVLELARSGMGRNEVARESGVSADTVTRICRAAKPPVTFDRAQTKVATEARLVDLKARRTALSTAILDDVDKMRERLFAEYLVRSVDRDGNTVEYMALPTARDWRDTLTAIGIGIDKHIVLTRHDSDDRDLPAVDAWLAAMMGAAK